MMISFITWPKGLVQLIARNLRSRTKKKFLDVHSRDSLLGRTFYGKSPSFRSAVQGKITDIVEDGDFVRFYANGRHDNPVFGFHNDFADFELRGEILTIHIYQAGKYQIFL